MTLVLCPGGCGGVVNTGTDDACPSCRRALNVVEIAPPGICYAWFGSPRYRMRCRKPIGHTSPHCEHPEYCGAQSGASYCAFPPDHQGPHAWERASSPSPERPE